MSQHLLKITRKFSRRDTRNLRKLEQLSDLQFGRIGDIVDGHELLLADLVLVRDAPDVLAGLHGVRAAGADGRGARDIPVTLADGGADELRGIGFNRRKDFHETEVGVAGGSLIPDCGNLGWHLGDNALALRDAEHDTRADVRARVHITQLAFLDVMLRGDDLVVIAFFHHVGLVAAA